MSQHECMLPFLVGLTLLQDPGPTTAPRIPLPGDAPITVRVLVLNYDPIVASEGGKRVHVVLNYNDPRKLADGYSKDISQVSGNFIRFRIVEWRDLDEIPVKTDGFTYSIDEYLRVMRKQEKEHSPDSVDYPALLKKNGVGQLVDANKIDEVWLFGGPFFGYWEDAMAGPGAFDINGGVYPDFPTKTPFAIMGFNYERGVAEMIHDLAHRTERTMARVYGRWEPGKPTNPWEAFSAYDKTSPGLAGAGNCHFPPNAEKDYDYSNPRFVNSYADDWLTYPKLTGKAKFVNRDTWGGPDYQRNYLKWWFTRLPKASGMSKDGRQNNWWKYVFGFKRFDEQGKRIKPAA